MVAKIDSTKFSSQMPCIPNTSRYIYESFLGTNYFWKSEFILVPVSEFYELGS